MCITKSISLKGERKSILQCNNRETVAGLIRPSKLFRLVQCNDLIATMTHNRNNEEVNLLSSLTLFSCHCLCIIVNAARHRRWKKEKEREMKIDR